MGLFKNKKVRYEDPYEKMKTTLFNRKYTGEIDQILSNAYSNLTEDLKDIVSLDKLVNDIYTNTILFDIISKQNISGKEIEILLFEIVGKLEYDMPFYFAERFITSLYDISLWSLNYCIDFYDDTLSRIATADHMQFKLREIRNREKCPYNQNKISQSKNDNVSNQITSLPALIRQFRSDIAELTKKYCSIADNVCEAAPLTECVRRSLYEQIEEEADKFKTNIFNTLMHERDWDRKASVSPKSEWEKLTIEYLENLGYTVSKK